MVELVAASVEIIVDPGKRWKLVPHCLRNSHTTQTQFFTRFQMKFSISTALKFYYGLSLLFPLAKETFSLI